MYCLACKYDLRGQVEPRCPECGRRYDPSNPATFRADLRWHAPEWLHDLARAFALGLLSFAAVVACLLAGARVPRYGESINAPIRYEFENLRYIAPAYVRVRAGAPDGIPFWPGTLRSLVPRSYSPWSDAIKLAILGNTESILLRRPVYAFPVCLIYAMLVFALFGRPRRQPAVKRALLLAMAWWPLSVIAIVAPPVAVFILGGPNYAYLHDYVYLPVPAADTMPARDRTVVIHSARPCCCGLYAVGYADGKWGVTTRDGLRRRLKEREIMWRQ